jgi:Protein of unknown function (DUF998)
VQRPQSLSLLATLAMAIRQLAKGSWGSRVGSLLVAVYGAGAILSAVFPTDRIDSPTDMSSLSASGGAIHIAVAIASFLSIIVGMFILTRTFSKEPRLGVVLAAVGVLPSGLAGVDHRAAGRTADRDPAACPGDCDLLLADPGRAESPLDRDAREVAHIQPGPP